ncbi:MAG: hypothetical protein WC552_02160 [Candidatus Omnitrophota bacterium]
MIRKLLEFLGTHFEIIFLVNLLALVILAVFFVFSRAREWTVSGIVVFLRRLLFYTVVAGELIVVISGGYVYWLNYQQKSESSLTDRVLPNTGWIKDPSTVYFVSDNELLSVQTNGANLKKIFVSEDAIRQYHFSPNGRYILIVTEKSLALAEVAVSKTEVLERIDVSSQGNDLNAVIENVGWSPDSQRFCYEISKWSRHSSQANYYVFDLATRKRSVIKSPARRFFLLLWDEGGENIYGINQEALDTQFYAYPSRLRIFRIPLSNLTPELAIEIPTKTTAIPYARLELSGIKLFSDGKKISFDVADKNRLMWVSDKGSKVGIDQADHFYYVRNQWWRKRLFYVPREPVEGDLAHYWPQGGKLPIRGLKWLPGSRYVIIAHNSLGVLVLEPATGKIGQLIKRPCSAFGWYEASK